MRDIREVHLKPDGGVDVSFSIWQIANAQWLIIKICGDYGIGTCGNQNGAWISCMAIAGLIRFSCHGVVLDVSQLHYVMSDSMYGVILQIRKQHFARYPVYILVSDRSKVGIVSLLKMAHDQSTHIIEDLGDVKNCA